MMKSLTMLCHFLALLCFTEAFVATHRTQHAPRRLSAAASLDVVGLAKEYVATASGFYTAPEPDKYAEDFVFRGGVIGPLNKTTYLETMEILGIYRAFEIEANAFGFARDPDDPNAVNYFVRNRGTHVRKWDLIGLSPRPGYDSVVGKTEAAQIVFDDDGKVKFLIAGVPVGPRHEEANVGGYGAVLGVFSAVGLDLAAKAALSPVVRKVANALADLVAALGLSSVVKVPRTRSTVIPSWYAALQDDP